MSIDQTNQNDKILVADIGGTNARFGIAEFNANHDKPTITHFHIFECSDHHDIVDLITHYLNQLPTAMPSTATFAVAAPITDNKGIMTNLGWQLDGEVIATALGFTDVSFINDFGALAMSTPSLNDDDLITVRSEMPLISGPISVIGPGTGFGVALLVPSSDSYIPVSTEGGHISFAPKDEIEKKIWETLSKDMDRVSIETLLSGIGIMRLYRALCSIHGCSPRNYDARTISQLGTEGGDAICTQALTIFCSLLGSVAGDIALVHGARGGVFLGGGILPKIAEFFLKSSFLERFLDKDPMQEYLKAIPIHLITAPDAALIGAGIHGQNRLNAPK